MKKRLDFFLNSKEIRCSRNSPNQKAVEGIKNMSKLKSLEKISFTEFPSAIKLHAILNIDFYGINDFEKYLKENNFDPKNLNFMYDEYYYSFTQGNMEFYFYPKL
jgi:hypothetical protein